MLEARVEVLNSLGLHARAAAHLVRTASKFQSKIILTRLDNAVMANAKSILSVLTLAASAGTTLILNAEGHDEASAFDAIQELFGNGFGEL
jgi:phosphotransferase system HPr (HPr) family protein